MLASPNFEPQETIKIWFMLIQVGSWLFYATHSQDLCGELGEYNKYDI